MSKCVDKKSFTKLEKYSIMWAYKLHINILFKLFALFFMQNFQIIFIFKNPNSVNQKGGGKFITKKIIKIFSCVFTVILAIIVGIIISKHYTKAEVLSNTSQTETNREISSSNIIQSEKKLQEWKIEIPSISLIANISEGTDEETLNKFVGHFELTPNTEGNVGLAAHNRGYPINYFENLKNLKEGEEIIYTCGEFTKTYIVNKNIKISETDWSYLENSNENKITLITCIENEPTYRRCVQATEKEDNNWKKH